MTAPAVPTVRPISVWAFVLFTGSVFGAGGLVSKSLINGGVDAYTVTGAMFMTGAVAAWAVAVALGQVRKEAMAAGLLLGTFNSAFPALFFNLGFETLDVGVATLIQSLGPVITAVVAHGVFADERISLKKGVGLALAILGVAALVLVPGVIEGSSYRGVAWTVAGVVFAGGTAVLARRYALRHGARALIAPQLTAAGCVPLVAGWLIGRELVPPGGFAPEQIIALGGLGLVTAYGGFRSMMHANEIGTTGQVSMIAYLIPPIGVAGGIILFGESLTPWIVLGGALILAGVTVAGKASAHHP